MRIQEFLDDQHRLSERTKKDYAGDLARFEAETGGGEPTQEKAHTYIRLLEKRGRSASHISRTIWALRKYCGWAKLDAIDGVEPPGIEVRTILPSDVVKEREVMALMGAARTPLERALVALIYDTACRISEILRLDAKQDVDWDAGVVYIIRKGRRRRREPVAPYPETMGILKEYMEWRGIKSGPAFPYSYDALRKWLIALAKRANVKFPRYSLFHNLRHARAAEMRMKGVPIDVIKDQLGHVNVNTTINIYAPFAPEELRDRGTPPPWANKGAIKEETR